MEKLYYSISEVATMLGESTSLVRFWSNTFTKFIHPKRNAKGNRMFTAADVEAFKQIHHLVKGEGLSLEGAAKKLSASKSDISSQVRVVESLRDIRNQLVEIRKTL